MSPSIPAPICGVRLERGRSRRAAPARAPPETANDPRHGPPRSARGRHHPHPLDRWRPAGELRAPRRTDGRRADDVRPVDPPSPPLAAEPGLAQPGPLRAVGRSRVDAPVLDAPPDGLRRQPRRPQGLPAVGLDHPGSPGIRPDLGGRGDDRTARPGPRERHRHGHRGAAAGGGVQPARARHRRPPDLRHRQRRRHAGGGRLRGLLAGRPPKLGKLVVLYDDNRIQLDGPTAWAFSEDVLARFEAYGWHTQRVEDGNDIAAISAAIDAAKADDRPSVIAVRTHIGFGSPNKQDTQKAHGAPLGPDEVKLTKEAYGWDPDRTFYVPDDAAEVFHRAIDAGKDLVAEFHARLDRYTAAYPGRVGGAPAPPRGQAARGLGQGRAFVRGRDRGRDAQREPGLDPGAGGRAARAVRRLRGPLGVEPDRRQGQRPRPLRGRPRRTQPALRRPRARDGRDRERDRLPRRLPPLLRDVPDLQRLHARVGPARRPVRPPRDLRLDARLGGPGRGRPDAPARRALRRAACDPEPVVRAARRRERGGGGLGAGDRAADAAGAHSPVRSPSRSPARSCRRSPAHRRRRARACGAAGTCCARRRAGRRS